jgi:HlyD family secretion protein
MHMERPEQVIDLHGQGGCVGERMPMRAGVLARLTTSPVALREERWDFGVRRGCAMAATLGRAAAFLTAALCVAPGLGLPPFGDLSRALAADDNSANPPSSLPVTVAEVRQRCFTETLECAGRLVPRQEILVRPEIEGLRVSQVLVEEGDRVTEGQVLARLGRPEGQTGSLPAAATVKSPAAGLISYRAAQARAPATVRGEPLFRVIADGEMELQAEVPAARLSKLAPGQSATLEIPGMTEKITGHVRTVSPAIDPKTQMAGARIFLGDRRLPVGAFAKAVVVVGQRCGPSIPLSAVIYRANAAIVQVVRGDRIETRLVQTGLLSGENVEIRDGLRDGELVVARSGGFLREGDRVRVVAPQEPPRSR